MRHRLQAAGVRTAFLWVPDGNDAAVHLYERVGFVSTNHRQPLPAHPGRSEERMQLKLGLNQESVVRTSAARPASRLAPPLTMVKR